MQFRSSIIRQYVMRFTLTIIVIVTIIKKKHLLSDEIFMETFQDGEFLMKCRNTSKTRLNHGELLTWDLNLFS